MQDTINMVLIKTIEAMNNCKLQEKVGINKMPLFKNLSNLKAAI